MLNDIVEITLFRLVPLLEKREEEKHLLSSLVNENISIHIIHLHLFTIVLRDFLSQNHSIKS